VTVAVELCALTEAAELQSRSVTRHHPIRAPLGAGEAACVAIASRRAWSIVTDDDAALAVMRSIHGEGGFEYERIRKLLIRAGQERLVTNKRANDIHEEMRGLGFWDKGTPFPES
jgi:predicted nucleic acid-binding protein